MEASSEIDEILQQIVELDKWREIFNSRGYAHIRTLARTLSSLHVYSPVFTFQVGITTWLC